MVLRFPQLYKETQLGQPFGKRVFLTWMIAAVFQSATIFFLSSLALDKLTGYQTGHQFGQWAVGESMFLLCVHIANLQLALEVHTFFYYFVGLSLRV